VALFAWLAATFLPITVDDAFIIFRHSDNLAHGGGFGLNPNEPIEGSSGLLYTYVLAGLALLGVPLEAAAKGLGLLALVLAMPLGAYTVRRDFRFVVVFGILTLVSLDMVVWSVLGLETILHANLVFLFYLFVSRITPVSERQVSALLVFSGCLVLMSRPEGFLFVGVGALSLLLTSQLPRDRLLTIFFSFFVFAAALTAFRWFYFDDLLPNTYFAKVASGQRQATIFAGVEYLSEWLSWGWWYVALLMLGLVASSRGREWTTGFLFIGAQIFFITYAAGKDWMPLGRHLVPVLPIVVFLSADALFSSEERLTRLLPWLPRHAVSAVLLLAIVGLSIREGAGKPELKAIAVHYDLCMQNGQRALGRWLSDRAAADSAVAARDIGALAYFSRRRVIDLVGLTDRHIARTSGFHNRHLLDLDYVFSKDPDFIIIDGKSADWRDPIPSYTTTRLFADPRFPEYHHVRSFACHERYNYHVFVKGEQRAAALRRLESLSEMQDTATTAEHYVNLSLTYYQAYLYQRSVESCRKALEIEPQSHLAYNNMCASYTKLGEWEKAIESCESALEIQPSFGRARANLEWARNEQTAEMQSTSR
jgi:tetratricopeptide (TPR) repeat protein